MTRRQGAERRNPERTDKDRRTVKDRRGANRVSLRLDVAVPVLVRGPDGLQRGLARNISQGGMLIEMNELPAIGSRLEITFSGITSASAVTLHGDVRHQLAWQHSIQGKMQTMRGVGLRFVDDVKTVERMPSVGDWVH